MSSETNARESWKLVGIAALLSVLICVVLAAGFFLIVFPHKSPPNERQVILNFNAHRAEFERLRTMLAEDKNLIRLANWGVQTSKELGTSENPTADFPAERYHQYLDLLRQAGGLGTQRDRADPPADICIWIFASGWAGDTRHQDICWEKETPPNQVASLDNFYRTPKPRKPVFRHIEDNWYLWADW